MNAVRDIYLYGDLAEKFGKHHRFAADTVPEVIRAFKANYPKFFHAIHRGTYRVVRGFDAISGTDIPEQELGMILPETPLHIIPVPEGAGGSGKSILTVVLGVVLIAAAVVFAPAAGGLAAGMAETAFTIPLGLGAVTYGQIAMFGAILALSGLSQLFAPQPGVNDYTRGKDERQSHLFNGAVNRMEQGMALPVVYGTYEVGSVVVSAGITINEHEGDDPDGTTYYNVTVDTGAYGCCNPGAGKYLANIQQVFYFSAQPGYRVSEVKKDGNVITLTPDWEYGGGGYYAFTVTADTAFVMTAEQIPYA